MAGCPGRRQPAGQRLAIVHGWQPEWRRRRSLVPGSLFLLHTLQVAELHTRLVESERSQHVELLELSAEPSCWRTYDGPHAQREVLKPDSFVRLGIGEYEDSYFIEVDRGTEGSRALDRQLAAYVAYHLSGREQRKHGVFPRVLWTTPRRSTRCKRCWMRSASPASAPGSGSTTCGAASTAASAATA